ncbi:hypothetical protein [Streptomyces sp. LN325]
MSPSILQPLVGGETFACDETTDLTGVDGVLVARVRSGSDAPCSM